MTSADELKRMIQERGVRRHERQAILRLLVEEGASERLRARVDAENEARAHRDRLAHVDRVSTLGEMAAGMALLMPPASVM